MEMRRAAAPMPDDKHRRRGEALSFHSFAHAPALEVMQWSAKCADDEQTQRAQSKASVRPAVFPEAREQGAEASGEERMRDSAPYCVAVTRDAGARDLPKRARNASIPSRPNELPS
jgi:hypothetical protein